MHFFPGDAAFRCTKLVEPLCKGLGYDETVVSESNQKRYSASLKYHIGNHTANKCGEMRRQIVCAEHMPACKDKKLHFLCRKKCTQFFDTCDSPFFYGKDMCIEFPDVNTTSDLCYQKHWPRYENWPTPPTTLPPTTDKGKFQCIVKFI